MATEVLECGGVLVYQLLCGRELELPSNAMNMRNYCYMVVNTLDKTALVIDAAWNIEAVYDVASSLGVELKGSIYTHYHFDHCGGDVDPRLTQGKKLNLQGAKEVADRGGKIWAGEGDDEAIKKQCHLDHVEALGDGAAIDCGDLVLHILHTPGHTPGSICIYAAPRCLSPRSSLGTSPFKEKLTKAEAGVLITGDTLFVGSCGRTDLPGSSAPQMLTSLARLSTLDPGVIVLPGHAYSPEPFTSIGTERSSNASMVRGISHVPKPPRLPRCVACGPGRDACGPKGFIIGRKVRMRGLTSDAGKQLNGMPAVVQEYSEEKGRYEVLLVGSKNEVKVIKAENLEAASQEAKRGAPEEKETEQASGQKEKAAHEETSSAL